MKKLIPLLLALLATSANAQQSVFVPATTAQIQIAGTVAGSTRIVQGIASKSIYVTSLALIPVTNSVVTFTSGTGTNCGTGTQNVTGVLTFTGGQTLSFGDGYGAVLVIPQGADLCITIATQPAPGSMSYAIF